MAHTVYKQPMGIQPPKFYHRKYLNEQRAHTGSMFSKTGRNSPDAADTFEFKKGPKRRTGRQSVDLHNDVPAPFKPAIAMSQMYASGQLHRPNTNEV